MTRARLSRKSASGHRVHILLRQARTARVYDICALSEKQLLYSAVRHGGVPEWLKGADCKSVGLRLRWFESNLLHHGEWVRLLRYARVEGNSRAGVVQW